MSKNTNYSSGQPFLGQLLSFFPKNIFEIIALTGNRLVISTPDGRDYLNKRFEFGR